ncbi:MAG: MFS transporter [Planctomycetaceae bacterium]|nr:MFS transporter [Planctomycetaceae bacterium]
MESRLTTTGRWLALSAAILGWMFDGLEMGLFPLAARPALKEVLFSASSETTLSPVQEQSVKLWYAVMTANFLVGAATGGVLFGWLGDRLGRVRAMALSVLTYALFSGLCGTVTSIQQLFLWRFVASLGMGGEWALGVSLVMELWPSNSRGWLAGLIGAASNVGFVLIAVVSMSLNSFVDSLHNMLVTVGLPSGLTTTLMANDAWRMLMVCGAIPALLTFFIRVLVPESERWLEEKEKGSTGHWATQDLLGVVFGSLGPLGMIYLWANENITWTVRWVTFLPLLGVAIVGYMYPVMRYLSRAKASGVTSGLTAVGGRSVIAMMLVGASLSGIALMGTWGSLQWASPWAAKLAEGTSYTHAKEWTQIVTGTGAILGTIGAALLGHTFGRRITYIGMCVLSLVSVLALYQLNDGYGTQFLITAFFAGGLTASFYGWLPLYLPELFPTRVRATGQGFAFNFGRILAAAGALQQIALMQLFQDDYPKACSVMVMVYLVGVLVIWLAPETRGTELIE